MRAVNLVPPEARQGGLTPGKSGGAVYGVIGGLAALLLIMSVAAVSKKDRAAAEAELAQVQQSTQQYAQVAGQYARYKEAASGASQRIQTITELSGARFDWAGTLRDLARVVPATARIDSLDASVKDGAGGGGGSAVRGALPVPAIALEGCTRNQATAADLVTRLQAMRRVTNVTLESSTSAAGSASTGSTSCTGYSFKLVVFYAPGDARNSTDITSVGGAETTTASQTTPPADGAASGGGE